MRYADEVLSMLSVHKEMSDSEIRFVMNLRRPWYWRWTRWGFAGLLARMEEAGMIQKHCHHDPLTRSDTWRYRKADTYVRPQPVKWP